MNEYYCPYCNTKIDIIECCGTTSYYCEQCNKMIEKEELLTKEEVEKNINK